MRFPKGHKVKIHHNGGSPITINKPLRNGPCPCGSSLKYKKCCMDRQIVNSETGESFIIKRNNG